MVNLINSLIIEMYDSIFLLPIQYHCRGVIFYLIGHRLGFVRLVHVNLDTFSMVLKIII